MKKATLRFGKGFRVVFGNERAQAAQMTLPPGDSEGGDDNSHRGADQWLFVVAGSGRARIGKRSVALREGTLLLIEAGETHEIRNTGDTPLKTLNLYAPPAYTAQGDELPRGRKRGST
jgi:mannose-6-phosphate isomerase-like protein (cupin superfamily)